MLKKLNCFGPIWSSDVAHNVFWLLISLSLIDLHPSYVYNQLTPERILPERALASFFLHLKHQREEESYQSEACGLMVMYRIVLGAITNLQYSQSLGSCSLKPIWLCNPRFAGMCSAA